VHKLGVSRDDFQDALHRENIGSGVHYVSVHLQDYYRRTFGYKAEDFVNALRISERTLSLPLSAKLTEQDVNDVIAAVRKLCAYYLARRGAES
jgi:dTDP-4-amino-4,6-dideoxygalactose transaminase